MATFWTSSLSLVAFLFVGIMHDIRYKYYVQLTPYILKKFVCLQEVQGTFMKGKSSNICPVHIVETLVCPTKSRALVCL